jgi:streptogramin lyase
VRPFLTLLLLAACCVACSPSASLSSSVQGEPTSGEPSESQPTPVATTAGGHPALIVDLGVDAAPIDVAVAFGSVWVANHHSDSVVRIDPATGLEQARIAFTDGTGPGWFAVSDDGVWVTRQNHAGAARIDPETNELDPVQAGSLPPCGPPAVALGAVWYFACDTGQMVRIDLATGGTSEIDAADLSNPIAVDEALYAVGPEGVVRLADDGETWTLVGGCCGLPFGYAGGTIWLIGQDQVVRVDPMTGQVEATIPLAAAVMSAGDEVAWFTPREGNSGPLEQVRMADNAILEPLQTSQSPTVVRVDGTTLWVTDFGASEVWRVDLGE